MTYDIIYADPPWDYKGQTKFLGNKKTSEVLDHYPTLTLNELKQLPVPSICSKNCLLFMWSSSPHLDQALDLMKAWGFDYKTIAFVWDKQKVLPGFYTMSQVEVCLVGKHGTIPKPRGARNVRQFITEPSSRHSAKPEEVRNRIELMFPTQKKLEMFARSAPAGWDVFGNDIKVLDNTISLI